MRFRCSFDAGLSDLAVQDHRDDHENDRHEERDGDTGADLLVINKKDLAPYVRASLEVMERDARQVREDRPFILTNCLTGEGLQEVADRIERTALRHAD